MLHRECLGPVRRTCHGCEEAVHVNVDDPSGEAPRGGCRLGPLIDHAQQQGLIARLPAADEVQAGR